MKLSYQKGGTAEIINNLGGVQLIANTTDGITGYKVNGADTVFPFSAKAELLWTNPSPTSAFGSQSISIDTSEYENIIIVARIATSNDKESIVGIFPSNNFSGYYLAGGYGGGSQREIKSSSTTSLVIGNNFANTTMVNNCGIPVRIYGLKKEITFC